MISRRVLFASILLSNAFAIFLMATCSFVSEFKAELFTHTTIKNKPKNFPSSIPKRKEKKTQNNPKMAERETSESEDPSSSGSEYEDAQTVEGNGVKKKKGLSEYEKQRMSRIAENRARLEALGLPQIASSFKGSSQPHKATKGKEKKKKVKDDDDEELHFPVDVGTLPNHIDLWVLLCCACLLCISETWE